MEVLNTGNSASCLHSTNPQWIRKEKFFKTQISCLVSANGCSSPAPFHPRKICVEVRDRKSVIAEAKKKKKVDSHSFIPKEDEATGPFPEAVLLKQTRVQDDGRELPDFADAEEEELFEFLGLKMESDLNLKEMRHYEVVYLIHEDHKEEVGTVNAKIEEFIKERKGRIWRFSDWGLRRLEYKIQKARSAHYILMNFELEADLINDFKSMLDKDERVIRHLVIKRDNAITEHCPPPIEYNTLRPSMDSDDDDDEEDMDYDDEDDYEDDVAEEEDTENDVIVVDEKDDEEEGAGLNDRSSMRKVTYA